MTVDGSIFDAIDDPGTGTIFDVADKVDHVLPDDAHDENIPWYQSYPSALGKGLIKGTIAFGRMMGPTLEPYDPEQTKQVLDELLPTEEGFVEGTLDRAGELFPLVATGGGSGLGAVARTGGAALSGQIAKEAGGGELVQSLTEIPALIGPDLKKMIEAGKGTKELVDFARRKGMAEEEIAPLIQSAKKQSSLGKFAMKRGGGQKILSKSKEAIGGIYQDLLSHPEAKTVLAEPQSRSLISNLESRLKKMPAKVRNSILDDLADLKASPKAAEDIMNFYADINSNLSGKTKQLASLKQPLVDSVLKIDKGLASDFQKTNKLYQNWAGISKTLKPTLASDLFEGSMPIRFVVGLTTGYPPIIAEVVGEAAGKKLASQLLLNPRFQGLGKKMVTALNNNKLPVAKNIWSEMTKQVDDVDKAAAQKMMDIDILSLLEDNEKT